MMHVTFSVNDYDRDGDISDPGIFLHFGQTRVKVADNFPEFEEFCLNIERCKLEIKENYDI